MTLRKRTIVDMAREAGIRDCTCSGEFGCLDAFAALVREDERDALCKLMADQNTWDLYDPNHTAIEIIRTRGQA
jgi:hypothetical protein